jgi:hypothetical protein
VVEEHVGRWHETLVDNPVGYPDFVTADVGFYPANEMQIFSKHGCLLDDAFSPQDTTVIDPTFTISDEAGGNIADPAMERVVNGSLTRIIEMVSRDFFRAKDMI